MRFMGMFGLLNSHLLFTREAYPTNAYQTLGNLNPAPRSESGGPGDEVRAPEGICVGDPRQISEAARRWESIGVDQINFILNVSNVLSQQQVLESLRLFAREVMPAFSSAPRAAAVERG